MKYWLYSEGNILGPYDPAEMLGLPAFTEESLVCAETATGDNADDWKSAAQMPEIASLLGSGRAMTASVAAGAYRLESVMSTSATNFDEKEYQTGASYSDLLDTIDNILGTSKEEADPTRPQPVDYELAEKFDIRLSRIQEELEAARWEKNLLLEKMRMKEMEEKKNRARIDELEARLKGELRGAQMNARELEQTRHLTDLTERSETAKKIEEIKREELSLEKYLVPEPETQPGVTPEPEKKTLEPGVKTLKSITPTGSIGLKRMDGVADEEPGDSGIAPRKLKSLGQTQAPAYVYPGAKKETPGSFKTPAPAPEPAPAPAPEPAPRPAPAESYGSYRETPLASPEPAPAGAYKGFENMEPLPQQEAGLVYDFTVVTAKPEGTSQQFKIEPGQQEMPHFQQRSQTPAQAPAHAASPMEFVPVSAPHPFYQQPQVFNPSMGQTQQAQSSSFSPSAAPSAAPAAAEHKPGELHKDIGASEESPDKTQRLSAEMAAKTAVKTAVPMKDSGKAGAAQPGPKKKGGKMAFVVVILIFGFIAAGGLGYFFLGEGVSFSEFSMLNFGSKKTAGAAANQESAAAKQESAAAQQEGAAAPAAAPEQTPAQPAADAGAQQQQPAPGSQPAGPEQQAPQAAVEKPSENIRRALDIVKTYKLAGGRGSIESWFANSFLSGGAGGANEEWTATPLHGDILVVQYRLIRPKQDPMMYQFEVDSAKGSIVRGINNNAIELLDASREKTVSAAPVRKAKQPRLKKPAKPREVSILPLPDAPAPGAEAQQDPTGFEQPENDDKVKYLKAQESDEELF
ncbi:MAG: hypothetical protein WCK76_12835 [Elusimicrobiota bacterium]